MGYNEEEQNIKPPPRGWPPPKKVAHNIRQIVYNGSIQKAITKGRCHEQEKVYHKKERRSTPDARNARNSREGVERVYKQLHYHNHPAVRKAAQPAVRHMAARTQAWGDGADNQKRQTVDISRI